MKRLNVALDSTRAEMVGMVAPEPVVKEAPKKVGQTHQGVARTRVTAVKRIRMMHAMGTGELTVMIVNETIAIMRTVVQ